MNYDEAIEFLNKNFPKGWSSTIENVNYTDERVCPNSTVQIKLVTPHGVRESTGYCVTEARDPIPGETIKYAEESALIQAVKTFTTKDENDTDYDSFILSAAKILNSDNLIKTKQIWLEDSGCENDDSKENRIKMIKYVARLINQWKEDMNV